MRVKLQIPAHSSRDQRKRIISPGRGEIRLSPEPLNLNSEQALSSAPAASNWASPGGGPMAGGGPWQGGAGKPQEPCTVLLHSPTPPLARLHIGDRRAWDGLWEGGGERLAGEAGDSGKIPRGPLQPWPHHRSGRDSAQCFLLPLFCSRPRQGKEDRRLEPQGAGRSEQAAARGP